MKTYTKFGKNCLMASLFITSFIFMETFAQNGLNFYSIRDGWNSYYDQHPDLKSEQGSGYKDFKRWEYFWETRVYSIDTSNKGDFSFLGRAMDEYYNGKGSGDFSSIIAPNWRFIGPELDITVQAKGLVNAIYVDTINDRGMNIIYAGSNSSGIWKTTDGGSNWYNVTDYSGVTPSGINNITGDPNNGNILFAATGGSFPLSSDGYGRGIIRSTDGGETWQVVYPLQPSIPEANTNLISHQVLVDPTNSERVYALVFNKLWFSEDGGDTWDTIFSSYRDPGFDSTGEIRQLREIRMKPGDPSVLYVASDHRHWHGLRRSQVYKVTYANTPNPIVQRVDNLFPDYKYCNERFALAVSPASSSSIWVMGNDTIMVYDTSESKFKEVKILKVWKSDDEGSTWKKVLDVPPYSLGGGINYFRMELMVSPTDTGITYFGGLSMARLTHWDMNSKVYYPSNWTTYHVDTRDAVLIRGSDTANNGDNDILFVGNDGGVSRSITGCHYWTNLNGQGLNLTQFWGIGGSNSNPSWIGGGTQDNSFFILDPVNGWSTAQEGDMGKGLIDYNNPSRIYSSKWIAGPGIVVAKSDDYGYSWSYGIDPTGYEPWRANWPLVMNQINPASLLVGAHNVYKTTDSATSFQKIQVQSSGDTNWVDYGETLISIAMGTWDKNPLLHVDTNTIYIGYVNPSWCDTTNDNKRRKLLKTTDGGVTWDDLTPNIYISAHEVLCYFGLTDIEVSPTEPDSVWISLGGFTGDEGTYRVLVSGNGGTTWTEFSAGLPIFPVNCLKIWNNGKGGIFAGTDVGMFYRDNTFQEWQSFNNGLPPATIVSDIEIIDSTQTLRIGTYGRGMWEADLNCYFDADTLRITSDTTWETDRIMDRSIIVKNPATLTIRSKVSFPPEGKIFVEPGAALLVEGGTLTNACFSMWPGIEVWGNPDLPQNTANQGYVSFSDGAILENSRIGVTTCKKDIDGYVIWSTTGGLIHADSSVFRNNYKAIEFLYYSYTNHSNFNLVTFETTREFIDGISTPSDFVSLFAVHGVGFHGCTFQNTTVPDTIIPDERKGRGIYSRDASFTVDDHLYCPVPVYPCPYPQIIRSTFSKLYYGIRAINSDPSYYVNVKKSDFLDNYRGVHICMADYSKVDLNTFNIPKPQSQFDTLYGLYLDRCTGYEVQENRFHKIVPKFSTAIDTLPCIGLVVNNSGPYNNEIYKNWFDAVNYGILAMDQNRNVNGSTGLVLKCNDYDSTVFDKVITISNPYHIDDWGIAIYQGDSLSQDGPAGNTFSPEHNSGYSDIDNQGARFKYYHHRQIQGQLPRVKPDFNYNVAVRSVNQYVYDTNICCLSKLNQGGGLPDELKQEIAFESDTINNKETQLAALVDGGSTETLNSEIITSTPPEAMDLRNELLTKSPYLSDTTMQSAISKEDVLPNEMIRDVLVANPQSATSDKVLQELNYRSIPMPDSMMVEILANEEIVSAKDALESELASHKAKRAQALYSLIRFYKNDTISIVSTDSLISLYQNASDLSLRYKLAFEYLKKGDSINLNNTLASIPSTFDLDQGQSDVHTDYITLFSILQNEPNILEIDSTSLAGIQNLYNNGHEPVKSYARNILIARGYIDYHEPILLPSDLKSSKEKKWYKTGKFIEKSYMKIFPNPAKQYVIVEYNLKEKFNDNNKTMLIIRNLNGNLVFQRTMLKRQNQELINTSGFISGSYICSLVVNGKILESQKLIIE